MEVFGCSRKLIKFVKIGNVFIHIDLFTRSVGRWELAGYMTSALPKTALLNLKEEEVD